MGGKGEGVRIKSLTLLMTIMQIAIKGTLGRAVPTRLSNPSCLRQKALILRP